MPVLQPGRRLRAAGLSVSADLLSAPGYYAAGVGDLVRRRHGDGRVLGRRLGLRPRLGRGNVNINVNNRYVNNYNRNNNINRNGGATATGSTIRSIAAARRTRDRDTANRYGGATRGDSRAQRPGRTVARPRGRSPPPGRIGAGAPARIVPARQPGQSERKRRCKSSRRRPPRTRARIARCRSHPAATASAIAASPATLVPRTGAATPSVEQRAAAERRRRSQQQPARIEQCRRVARTPGGGGRRR